MYAPSLACPIEKLPSPFFEAVIGVGDSTQAPLELVLPDALAMTSTVVQRRYKTMGINGSVMATTLNTVSLGPTAFGKGESYRNFFQTPVDFKNDGPTKPKSPVTIDDLLLQDVTPSALMSCLAGTAKSASIQLEDGYSFLTGPLMKSGFISKLPQAWSGPPSMKWSRHYGNKDAIEPCLAIGLRIQPKLFYQFLRRNKSESRHLGLWPRFLTFCYDPELFPVTPLFTTRSGFLASHLPLIDALQALLPASRAELDSDQSARAVLKMDAHANAFLREITYWIKSQINNEFYDIADAAGRAAENTLRLASNFHVVCQGEGAISREMIERAWAFVEWSLTQFRNVFVHALEPPPQPLKLKPMKLKENDHQHKLTVDMQFVLECVAACVSRFPDGDVPLADVALLAGFARSRFLKTIGWLATGRLIHISGSGGIETIRDLSIRRFNGPYGYKRHALL
jgi:hypothetical protein